MGFITRFADLHCHPHHRSYNWLHNDRIPEEKSKYNPWWIIISCSKRRLKSKWYVKERRLKSRWDVNFSQCDLAKVINGNLKLGFISLRPLEKGWAVGRKSSNFKAGAQIASIFPVVPPPINRNSSIAPNLEDYVGDNSLNEFLSSRLANFFLKLRKIVDYLKEILNIKDSVGSYAISDIIHAIYKRIGLRRINFIQSKRYDYFKELIEEKKFLDKNNGIKTKSKFLRISSFKKLGLALLKQTGKQMVEQEAIGTYVLAKNGEHVKSTLMDNKTVFVLTIEGANVFNTHNDFESIKENIKQIKSWDEPIFFITFAHHFNNFLAGHAHSMPDIGYLLFDQSEGLHSGFTEKGIKVLRQFLGLDENNEYKPDEFGRRILIDVKHLNAVSRKEYFKEIVLPSLKTENPIPVIASHVAFSGKKTHADLIEGMEKELDNSKYLRRGHSFNNWNINLCDEDVISIYKSKGLIGITLDKRELGVSRQKLNNLDTDINYIWQNLKGMMMAVVESNDPEINSKKEIVKTFCLGSNFDGMMGPLAKYPTVLNLNQLGIDLIDVINNDPDKNGLLFGLEPTTFVKKICFDNAYDFVVENFK